MELVAFIAVVFTIGLVIGFLSGLVYGWIIWRNKGQSLKK